MIYVTCKQKMDQLPASLFCLHLAYNLDDRDVIERCLAEYPEETRKCIPIALRQILESDELPVIPFFYKENIAKYLLLLWQNESINVKLIMAADQGLTYLIPYFLCRDVNIHADYSSLLRHAAVSGHTETVKYLLDRKADIHTGNDYTLRNATYNGHIEVIKLLINRNADIHAGSDDALRIAASRNNIRIVEFLLSQNADVHTDSDVALRNAAFYGYTEIVRLLLDRKADIHVLKE